MPKTIEEKRVRAREYMAARLATNPDHVRRLSRAWGQSPKGQKARHRNNLKKYGMTPEQYAHLLATQGGVCALCWSHEPRKQKGRELRMSVDHDHQTGVVRGLLCKRCNIGIGVFRDSPDLLVRAVEYLGQTTALRTTLSRGG